MMLNTGRSPTRPPPAPPTVTAVNTDEKHDSGNALLLDPCASSRCLPNTASAVTPPSPTAPSLRERRDLISDAAHNSPGLLNTGSEARWRRRKNLSNSNIQHRQERASQDLVLKVAVMEEVHGVDVSWLHHRNRSQPQHKRAQSSPNVKQDSKPATAAESGPAPQRKPVPQPQSLQPTHKLPSPPNVTPPTPVEPKNDHTNAIPSTPSLAQSTKSQPKRPSLLNRASNEKLSQSGSRRQSWMNSISSKFSSQPTPDRPAPSPGPAPSTPLARQMSQSSTLSPPTPSASGGTEAVEEAEPYTPSKPKESSSSFFSGIARRLSSQSQTGGTLKAQGSGGVCPRKVLNVDPNRERCLVPEMDPSRLRRVSFCVDVEIAGGPRYRDDDEEDDEERKRKQKQFKMKERAEGDALKRPEALAEEKDEQGEPKMEQKSQSSPADKTFDRTSSELFSPPDEHPDEDRDAASRKREKKQKSEAERKERKEKRRKRAEENGQIPVELMLDGDAEANGTNGSPATSAPQTPLQPQPNSGKQDKPTTDPARIYRRCCQLRESPILKRITEQLSRPNCILPQEPGVVNCLDLTGSRLQLADVISLGDWLAVVPVKQLKMEDADLNDEGVRCILAGLLAAKRPEPAKRKSTTPRHRGGVPTTQYQERAGIIERLTLKNNPRISRVGWKHISLFIYMCRSLKAIDLSMNQFPEYLPPSAGVTPVKTPQNSPAGQRQDVDAAEALYKCLSERLGGMKLEELAMSECGLSSSQLRKVVDGAIVSGVSRLGLAGNHLDDEGLQHVVRYLHSSVCQALDIGGNDLRGKLEVVADALDSNHDVSCWGFSLADCNLDSASLRPLFAALYKLPNFRFIDLSHNRDLCSMDNGLISLFRRYVGRMSELKRIHLADVGMSPKQAIALADVLPEGPRLAHLNLLENPQLTALANATNEADQEEACALYASMMAAVRVSSTLICIDIDVPSPDNSEVVKALAKQVVAYSLRNMEQFAIAEATGNAQSTANATAALTGPHGGEKSVKDITVPDVLFHLVGHVEGSSENHDNDGPAPDDDYIVGGTGVVKALQYVLGEKANDDKRHSIPGTPTGGYTPRGDRPGSSAGLVDSGKAKKMSKNLLGSARKIRERLQPALVKEAAAGDELAYRRLLFLDKTLQSMIERFETEYPETRLVPPSPKQAASVTSSITDQSTLVDSSINTQGTEITGTASDDDEFFDGEDDAPTRPISPRRTSDVDLVSRAQRVEEGRLHRIGQTMRREVIDSPRNTQFGADVPWKEDERKQHEAERLRRFGQQIEGLSGGELKSLIDKEGWDALMQKVGGNYADLRQLSEEDPEGWANFKEAFSKARMNLEQERA